MATEVFRLLGRISLDGTKTVEKGLKSVDAAAKASAQAMKNTGRTYAESMKLAEQQLERYKDRFIEANDYFQAKSNQSSKLIGALSNQEGPINRVTASLLRGGEALERYAKSGTAANLAIETLGKNASMKDLLDRIKLINTGIMRTQMLALGTTIIFGGMTAALANAAMEYAPLSTAAENFKTVWAEALQPFVESFGRAAAAVVNFFTQIGIMWRTFNETNPELAKMVSWFLYLLPAIMAILSPLAVGIGYFKGLRAVLFATQALWKPFVIGFLRVIAPAAAVTAVIVGAAFAIKEMWENSEQLRSAFGTAMSAISSAVSSALEPLGFWFDYLKGAFKTLIISITGGTGQANNTFKNMGDTLASVINWITGNLLPIFKAGISVAVTFIIGVIRAVVPVIQQLAMLFAQHSGTIKTVVSTAFKIIGGIIQFVMIGIVGTIQTYLQIALLAFRGVMNLINGVIQVFRGIFTGNWSMVWSGVVDILKGAGQMILAFLSATLLGRIMGLFRGMASGALGIVRGFGSAIGRVFSAMGSAISRVMSNIYNWVTGRIKSAINAALTSGRSLQTGLAAAFNAVLRAAGSAFNSVKNAIMTPINSVVSSVKTKVGEIKGFFTSMKLKIPKPNLPPMPHFKLEYASKTIMKKKIEYPTGFDVEWYDKGGIFSSPSVIGVGEKRPEFVGALDDLAKIVRGAMTEVISAGGGMGRLEVPLIVNGREIARAVADDIDEQLELRRRRNDRAAGRLI